MKRNDCYFGLHFDYHANRDTDGIGEGFDENVLNDIIDRVKPDYIQCDTKGHPGYCSYMTKVGNPAPGLCRDLLAMWRKVTKNRGVLLFSHYSGIWDSKATEDHPDWAIQNEDGKKTERASLFGAYCDELMILQLNELALTYHMDGAWVDGDCWALPVDYSEKAKQAYQKATGKTLCADASPEQKREYLEFQRKAFFEYVRHYIGSVKSKVPGFEITSNWLNTSWAPDDLCITDFISGDLSATNSVDSARFDGRIMQASGRNWDLMSWGISFPVHHVKSAAQLIQEASVVMSLGGGFQIYNMQNPQKTVVDEWAIGQWAEVSEFVRAREPYCKDGKPIPDIALIESAKAYYNCLDGKIFDRNCKYHRELNGVLLALCDSGRSVSVLLAQKLGQTDISQYKTIVISDLDALEEDAKDILLSYVKNGGTLFLCGCNTVFLFADSIGISVSPCVKNGVTHLSDGKSSFEARTPYAVMNDVTARLLMHECDVKGNINQPNPPPIITEKADLTPAYSVINYGKGKVGLLPINLGHLYMNQRTYELQDFFRACLSELGEGIISIDKTGEADVYLTEKDGKTYLHIINLLGEHRNPSVSSFSSVPELTDLSVTLHLPKAPKSIIKQPSGEPVVFTQSQNKATLHFDKIGIYTICEIE